MKKRRQPQIAYDAPEYLADPDFLACISIMDKSDTLPGDKGTLKQVEIGYGYKNKKGGGAKLTFYEDVRSKQLLFEAGSLMMVPFRRRSPGDAKQPKANARPRPGYSPALSRN